MTRRGWIGSVLLLVAVVGIIGGLAAWKYLSFAAAIAAAENQPEPMETVSATVATERVYQPTTTAIGTILALKSITLRNELPGTVRTVRLEPGQIVEPGTVLVALDVSVEEAELRAMQAQAALAETSFARVQNLNQKRWVADAELDRARAERDVAEAQIKRVQAVIERKTIRAPFRARVGIADVHLGQYLEEGTVLTTLQGVDRAVHVDFAVEQQVAMGLREGGIVQVIGAQPPPVEARIVAVDARVDPATRNAAVRARIENGAEVPPPGASVRVEVPVGPPQQRVAVPASAVRKGPGGEYVFALTTGDDGRVRAAELPVTVEAAVGDEVMLSSGLVAGERVAASGSFKLRDGALVNLAGADPVPSSAQR